MRDDELLNNDRDLDLARAYDEDLVRLAPAATTLELGLGQPAGLSDCRDGRS
jgi:hypothetical protein